MKTCFLRALLSGVLLALAAVPSQAADGAATQPEVSKLGSRMDLIGTTFRALRRAASDPARSAECADLAAVMLREARASLELEPAWKTSQPDERQSAFVEEYRKEMQVMIGLLEALEKAFRAGDGAEAQAIIGRLRDHQKESHRRFKAPDGE
jgi:soluble cytochrome b562